MMHMLYCLTSCTEQNLAFPPMASVRPMTHNYRNDERICQRLVKFFRAFATENMRLEAQIIKEVTEGDCVVGRRMVIRAIRSVYRLIIKLMEWRQIASWW